MINGDRSPFLGILNWIQGEGVGDDEGGAYQVDLWRIFSQYTCWTPGKSDYGTCKRDGYLCVYLHLPSLRAAYVQNLSYPG